MRRTALLFLFILPIAACERPNPHPESIDPIYGDLQAEEKSVTDEIKKAEKDLEGFKKDLESVVPQTGQVKYAQKRVNETQARLDKLRQMQIFWNLRAESRRKWDRDQYIKAFKEKRPWPDPQEFEIYKEQKKLENSPRVWSAKERMEEAGFGSPEKKESKEKSSEEPKQNSEEE